MWLTTDEEGTLSGPDRKRRKTEDSEAAAAAGDTPKERQAEALALLRRSRLISEEGIGATWGEPNPDIISASAAIRAWRPIQVPSLFKSNHKRLVYNLSWTAIMLCFVPPGSRCL